LHGDPEPSSGQPDPSCRLDVRVSIIDDCADLALLEVVWPGGSVDAHIEAGRRMTFNVPCQDETTVIATGGECLAHSTTVVVGQGSAVQDMDLVPEFTGWLLVGDRETGEPVAGAVARTSEMIGTSGTDGRVRLTGAFGDFVYVEHPDYPPQTTVLLDGVEIWLSQWRQVSVECLEGDEPCAGVNLFTDGTGQERGDCVRAEGAWWECDALPGWFVSARREGRTLARVSLEQGLIELPLETEWCVEPPEAGCELHTPVRSGTTVFELKPDMPWPDATLTHAMVLCPSGWARVEPTKDCAKPVLSPYGTVCAPVTFDYCGGFVDGVPFSLAQGCQRVPAGRLEKIYCARDQGLLYCPDLPLPPLAEETIACDQ
jgi:hypothetical protein